MPWYGVCNKVSVIRPLGQVMASRQLNGTWTHLRPYFWTKCKCTKMPLSLSSRARCLRAARKWKINQIENSLIAALLYGNFIFTLKRLKHSQVSKFGANDQ